MHHRGLQGFAREPTSARPGIASLRLPSAVLPVVVREDRPHSDGFDPGLEPASGVRVESVLHRVEVEDELLIGQALVDVVGRPAVLARGALDGAGEVPLVVGLFAASATAAAKG